MPGEPVHALAVVAHRVAGADGGLLRVAEQRRGASRLARSAATRRRRSARSCPIGRDSPALRCRKAVYCGTTLPPLRLPGWNRLHSRPSGPEPMPGDAAEVGQRGRRDTSLSCCWNGIDHFPPHAGVQRQARRHAPRVLHEHAELVLPAALIRRAEVDCTGRSRHRVATCR